MVYWSGIVIMLPLNRQTERLSFFSTTGHFLLLNPSSVEKDAGICNYHLTSPVLPGSDKHCVFQLALYESAPAVGNLTLLVKTVLSGSTVRSLSLNYTSRDDHRSAHTERTLMMLYLYICVALTSMVLCQCIVGSICYIFFYLSHWPVTEVHYASWKHPCPKIQPQ